jgi:glycosyltransferase involved in cell wall biosynthesis
MTIGVITPTYQRARLLRKFLARMERQSYPGWRLIVVHDGPDDAIKSLVDRARRADSRIAFSHTERRTNNYGVSPRIEGLHHMIRGVGADYCVFWDDDNLFSRHALGRIAAAIVETDHPDLLLMPIRSDRRVLPPRGVPVESLDWGQVDTGCLVVRPALALESYESMLKLYPDGNPSVFYTQDFKLFKLIREARPTPRIRLASGRPIGVHDGLRFTVYLRSVFAIKPLGLANRFFKRD